MHRTLAIVVIALILPVSALAAPGKSSIKQVEVTNFPDPQNVTGTVEVLNLPAVQDVNIVNAPPAPAACSSRFQLVGFTSATYTGDMGSYLGVTAKCQLEFPESRMCTYEEVVATTTISSSLTGEAWIHTPSGNDAGVILAANIRAVNSQNCLAFTRDLVIGSYRGYSVSENGNLNLRDCFEILPIACCAPVP